MARDYEGIHDVESMDDGEIRSLIEQELSSNGGVDPADVDVSVSNGRVKLEGRVGTEQEYQAIEHVVTDLLGIKDVRNDMVIDELRRGEQPEAADEAIGARSRDGGGADNTSDEAQHLMEDVQSEQFGTSDVGNAIEQGLSYNPPNSPVQEGTWSKENH